MSDKLTISMRILWDTQVAAISELEAKANTGFNVRSHIPEFMAAAHDAAAAIDVERLGLDEAIGENGYTAIVLRDAEPVVKDRPHVIYATTEPDGTHSVGIEMHVTRDVAVNLTPQQAHHICMTLARGGVMNAIDADVRARAARVLVTVFDDPANRPDAVTISAQVVPGSVA